MSKNNHVFLNMILSTRHGLLGVAEIRVVAQYMYQNSKNSMLSAFITGSWAIWAKQHISKIKIAWTIYSAITFLEKCRKVIREIWFEKSGSRKIVQEKWLTRKKGGFIP